jgi:hypothetical protein
VHPAEEPVSLSDAVGSKHPWAVVTLKQAKTAALTRLQRLNQERDPEGEGQWAPLRGGSTRQDGAPEMRLLAFFYGERHQG